jgi:hypothetical protein
MARQRSRYAPDAQVRRIARLAAELGITPTALRMGADGSVLITADTRQPPMAADQAEEALEAWEAEHNLVRRP